MSLYCGCERAGQLGEMGSLGREGWGEGRGCSEVPRWYPPSVSVKNHTVLAPMANLELYTDHISGFMGLGKPSSHVTTSPNLTPCLKDVVGGGMRSIAKTSPVDMGPISTK
jgi:hypothetical protein